MEGSRVGEFPPKARLIDLKSSINIPVIYGIHNKITNKWYVGSTLQLHNRIRRHLWYLKNNQHHSLRLQNAWNKYGEENFTFYILRKMNKTNLLLKWELYWIRKLEAFKFGYNGTESVIWRNTFKLKEEQKQNRIEQAYKPVICLTKDGKFVKEYESVKACALALHDQTTNISQACKNPEYNSVKGFLVLYKKDYNLKKQYKHKKKSFSNKHKYNMKLSNKKRIEIVDEFDNKWESIGDLCKSLGLYESYFRHIYKKQWKFMKEFVYNNKVYKKI